MSKSANTITPVAQPDTRSELTRALDQAIERAKQQPGMRPCGASLAKGPVAFYHARPDLLWYAVQSGAQIPPELKRDVQNMRDYERTHPGELSRLAAEVTRWERSLVEGVAPVLRQRSGGRGHSPNGRPAGRASRRGGDSGDSDPDDPEPPLAAADSHCEAAL